MKVGDLVRMKGGDSVFGLVADLEGPRTLVVGLPTRRRVGILWADGTGIDYEPKAWLGVVGECKNR